jgi:hypothetical protein
MSDNPDTVVTPNRVAIAGGLVSPFVAIALERAGILVRSVGETETPPDPPKPTVPMHLRRDVPKATRKAARLAAALGEAAARGRE